MFLPNSVYESLPIIYVLIGAAVMLLLEGTLALLSGGLLSIAGVVVFMVRRRNREAVAAMDRNRRR